jgi:hypothetical protein
LNGICARVITTRVPGTPKESWNTISSPPIRDKVENAYGSGLPIPGNRQFSREDPTLDLAQGFEEL